MGADALLAALPSWAFAFALVLARSSAAVMLLPGLGEAEPPATVRAGLAVALTGLLLPVVLPQMPPVPPGMWQLGSMVAAELLCGGLLGWLARLMALSLPIAGGIVSLLIGLASVLQPDPNLGGQSTALTRLFSLAVPVLVLSTGLYALPLQALAGSYQLVAPGTWLPSGGAAERDGHGRPGLRAVASSRGTVRAFRRSRAGRAGAHGAIRAADAGLCPGHPRTGPSRSRAAGDPQRASP